MLVCAHSSSPLLCVTSAGTTNAINGKNDAFCLVSSFVYAQLASCAHPSQLQPITNAGSAMREPAPQPPSNPPTQQAQAPKPHISAAPCNLAIKETTAYSLVGRGAEGAGVDTICMPACRMHEPRRPAHTCITGSPRAHALVCWP